MRGTLVWMATAVLVCAAAASAQTIQVDKNNRTIAVTASDKASAVADTASVTVGFRIYAPDAATAYSKGSQVSNAILDALKKAGVHDKAIESQDQKLAHTDFPEGEKSTPAERVQKAFSLSQSWTVETVARDAGAVLHTAIEAGANESGNIDWDVKDHNGLQAEAAAKALEHARGVAAQMAAGLNAHLGALIYASNQTPVQRLIANAAMESILVSAAPAPPVQPLAIRPQQVEESATVYAVFAIE